MTNQLNDTHHRTETPPTDVNTAADDISDDTEDKDEANRALIAQHGKEKLCYHSLNYKVNDKKH